MEENNLLAIKYNKKYAIQVYSGTLAIEAILKSLNLTNNNKVLISTYSCYSILQAVINSNLKPVIAIPKNGFLFSQLELKKIIKENNIKVYIAVHQYGYYQVISKIKGLTIIEDFSQAWNIKYDNTKIGNNSEYSIISFGKTKPLSNGIGGIILSNTDISKNFDLKTKNDRYNDNRLLEYYYPQRINYKKLIILANRKVQKQRKNADMLNNIFKKYKFINTIEEKKSLPSYHRYLIGIRNKDIDKLCSILDKCKILYQREYKIKLDELPITKKEKIEVIGKHNNLKYILIRTNNKKSNIKKLYKEMRKRYEK